MGGSGSGRRRRWQDESIRAFLLWRHANRYEPNYRCLILAETCAFPGRDWGRTKRFCAESYLTFQTRRFQVALQLWDTAGQERFRSMAPMYYRGAAAAIIVFDTTKDRAWNTIKAWHKDVIMYAEPGVVIGVAGNKIDVQRPMGFDLQACDAICMECDANLHLTSAQTGQGVNDLFLSVAKQGATLLTARQRLDNSVHLDPQTPSKHRVCCAI